MRTLFLSLTMIPCITCLAQNVTPLANKRAPEVQVNQVLQAPAGASRTLAGLRGKAVVLEFWATWCGGCIEAIPHLNEIALRFKDKPVVFLSITDENAGVVQAFLQKRQMSGWVGIDADGATFTKYGILARPQTILIDPHGLLREAVEPRQVTATLIDELIEGKPLVKTVAESKPPVVSMGSLRNALPALLQCLIRPAAPAAISGYAPGAVVGKEGGEIAYYGVTAGTLLHYAKDVRFDRMVAPQWFNQNLYDASITVPAGREDLRSSLLEQTLTTAFSMQIKKQSNPVSVYVVNGDGRRMHSSGEAPSRGFHPHPGQLIGVATPMGAIIATVEKAVDGVEVIDETGLGGNYDFDLHWEMGNMDSLRTALRDQLGLTLSKAIRQRDFLVVENAVQPTTL